MNSMLSKLQFNFFTLIDTPKEEVLGSKRYTMRENYQTGSIYDVFHKTP